MSRATTEPSTPDLRASQAAPSATLPTLAEMGRIHHAIWAAAQAINEKQAANTRVGSPAYKQFELEHNSLTEQGHALDALILASPIETLSDALVLAVHATMEAQGVAMDNDGACASTVHRALARIAVCLSYAVGTDLSELGSGGTDACILRSALVKELAA